MNWVPLAKTLRMEVDVAVRWVPLQAVVSPRIRTCLQVRKVMVNNYNLILLGHCPLNWPARKSLTLPFSSFRSHSCRRRYRGPRSARTARASGIRARIGSGRTARGSSTDRFGRHFQTYIQYGLYQTLWKNYNLAHTDHIQGDIPSGREPGLG